MSRNQGVVSSGAATSTLEAGILALSLEAWLQQYPTHGLRANVSSYLEQVLQSTIPSFSTATAASLLPLDRLSVGQALQQKSDSASLSTAESTALATLNASLALQPRNGAGGLWYYVYPEWSYLDGAVSFLPFMAAAGWPRTDMLRQLALLSAHCGDAASGLLRHGYDASRTAVWADPVTGASPYVWGRSLGWYLAGLVNAYEALSGRTTAANGTVHDEELAETALRTTIARQMGALSTTLVAHADGATGAWWQLPTLAGRAGNFLESSATALYVFALLKAVRLGIASPAVVHAAVKAYNYTRDAGEFVLRFDNGTLGYDKTVSVCSLNSTATYEYYTTRPLVPNSLLGEAAFVLASLEVERLR